MSNIDKQALRERYSPKPVPECHICGKEMTIQRMSASRITYGCTGATYDDKGCHYAEGRSIADDHYEQSRVTVVDVSNPDVLALLDELEHYKSREERVTKLVMDNSTSWDALYKKLEAAEKRNAELQSENAYIRNRYKELDLLIGKNILVMQAAIIEWQATGDAKSGLAWIYNTLFGPGELPDESEKDAQAYFNRKCALIDEKLMELHKWFWEQSEAESAAGIRIKGE
ncbi:TPA: ead/Ea22-like family protein [Salmonella enterica subsp. enterica serovar Napoli]|nr:ead/Ea22-like family protein [Salmonella enterica]ECD4177427.1 ead/Ea22-like family protein [Salmonella enterica subsp. enterica serovar Napoli]EDV0857758.1 ead/Ea22-like family protein [Salmonella enterica subsp. enterica]EIF5759813.1 ead/Ea22-like family protein [Salmonella enterica subsp. enterica serovar Napoli]HBB7238191.1 ead/Ea22-like family protein [Salmonella enterica subsp. enterica serovar Napoli]